MFNVKNAHAVAVLKNATTPIEELPNKKRHNFLIGMSWQSNDQMYRFIFATVDPNGGEYQAYHAHSSIVVEVSEKEAENKGKAQ